MGAVTQAQHWRAKFRIRIPVPLLKYGISDIFLPAEIASKIEASDQHMSECHPPSEDSAFRKVRALAPLC